MDAHQVKEMLAQQADKVCPYLLPGGRENRGEWVCADVGGGKGDSFRVHLAGPKAGWWADFANAEYRGRNLLDLWMAVRKCDFATAIKEARDFLGIRDDAWKRHTGAPAPAAVKKPVEALDQKFRPLVTGGVVWTWLTEVRKIAPDVLTAYRIGESSDGTCVVFPSYTADGKLACLKFRSIEDKKKTWVAPAGADGVKMLFGIQAVGKEQTECIITEGEIDALTFASYGFQAVSVPFGAKAPGADGADPNDPWIQHDYDWLERFLTVYLAMDGDEPGQKATAALIPRLGRHRVRVVQFPSADKDGLKDANALRQAGWDDHAFTDLVLNAKDMDPAELRKPGDFSDAIWAQFYPDECGVPRGHPTPWKGGFEFGIGELTIWHGYSASGKTTALNHTLVNFCGAGIRTLVASLEFPAPKTFRNITRCAMGKAKPTDRPEMDEVVRWLDRTMWIYAHVGQATIGDLMELFTYAARKYAIQHFVLDSLMMLAELKGDDLSGQKALVLALKDFAAEFQVHVHLVAHSKKPDAKHPPEKHWPSKHDISGSGDISNVADNVVCIWRNLEKERKLQEALDFSRVSDPDLKEKSAQLRKLYEYANDSTFIVQKCRETGQEPVVRLWFDSGWAILPDTRKGPGSWQFRDDSQTGYPKLYRGETYGVRA